MHIDLYNRLRVVRAISPDEGAGDNTAKVSQIIDTLGYDGCLFAIATGTIGDAGATFTVLLEHGDNASLTDAAAVPDAQLLGTETLASFTQADDDKTFTLGYIGQKRYLRLTITPANNATAWDISAVAILGGAAELPSGAFSTFVAV
jgi:hypothetical protein